ncbi:right-handed parallel beta-helix repeat-containing protein [Desertibaculum subflavum]|uniref:right-handed parallel beta-helix repeat-containing protein n=1 Tax=Desertibaculum subflavum TaxID=2268458 RepID=UPI000E66AA86
MPLFTVRRLMLAAIGLALASAAEAQPAAPAKDDSPLARAFRPRLLQVGPDRMMRKPSDAAAQARDGDTVEIQAGTYEDCAVWRANRLTLRAIGGEVHLKDKACEGKGIWVLYGDQVIVEGIRFSGARVADRNGAGIRAQGGALTVRNSVFERNENGILTNTRPEARIVVEGSTFIGNGKCEPQCAHGMYINDAASLEVRNSAFRDQRIGHHIKSRARRTVVTGCRVEDGGTGTASYLIDVPNGGEVLIEGNTLQKGRLSDNQGTAISIGAEGVRNPTPSIRIENNRFRSDVAAPEPVAFLRNLTATPAVLDGNQICGETVALVGPGRVRAALPCN